MKAVVYRGPNQVAVEDVPDPRIERPTDAIVKITSTNICGSDLTCTRAGPISSRAVSSATKTSAWSRRSVRRSRTSSRGTGCACFSTSAAATARTASAA